MVENAQNIVKAIIALCGDPSWAEVYARYEQDNFVIQYELLERPPSDLGLARPGQPPPPAAGTQGGPVLHASGGSQGGGTLPNTPKK